MTVLGVDGRSEQGAVSRLDERGVTLRTADGRESFTAWSQCLGLTAPADGDGPLERAGMLVLADGQRLPGVSEANASGWRWVQPLIGAIEPPSGTVRSISFSGAAPPPPSADADVVLLRTGDRLEGFVTELADPLPLEPRTPGAPSLLPMESIAAISFVSRDEPPDPARRRLWMRDGLVLDAAIVRYAGGDAVTLEGVAVRGAAPVTVPLSSIRAISGLHDASALALRPMATQASAQSPALRYRITAAERLRWPDRRPGLGDSADAPAADLGAWPLRAPSIAFDGPAILRVEIDRPATLRARAVLPRDRRPLGTFELFVRSGTASVGPLAFDDAHRVHEIRIDAEPPAIEFEIRDTGGGAVQDGVVIKQGVLMAPASSPTTPAEASPGPAAPEPTRDRPIAR